MSDRLSHYTEEEVIRVCVGDDHRPGCPHQTDRALADALLKWYDTTHGNSFGHDHHCPAPFADNPYTQPIFDGCTCGWSDVQRAEAARVAAR